MNPMRLLRHSSLQRKLTLLMMVIAASALVLTAGGFLVQQNVMYRDSLRQVLAVRAGVIGGVSTAALEFDDAKAAQEIVRALGADRRLTAGALYRASGELLAAYRRDSDHTALPAVVRGPGERVTSQTFAVWRPVQSDGQTIGYILLESDFGELHAHQRRLALMGALLLAVSLAAAFGLAAWLQRFVSRPLLHLLAVAQDVAGRKDFSVRARKETEDELGRLVDGFNDMLCQIQSRDAELAKSRELLEQRVLERTAALADEVTERKQAEHRLQESLRSLAAFNTVLNRACIISVADTHGRITQANDNFCLISGLDREELIGQPHPLLNPGEQAESLIQTVRRTLDRDGVWRGDVRHRSRCAWDYWVDTTMAPLLGDDGKPHAYLAISIDITERKRTESKLAGERQVLEMMAAGQPLSEILETLARNIEEMSDSVFCSILLRDQSGACLVHGAAPSLPATYLQAVDGVAIGPNAGSCGTAAHRKETVIVTDIATDPLWSSYRDLALSCGLRACWSKPVVSSDGEVLGTFAMYYSEPRSPGLVDLDLVQRAANLAGLAIEHNLAEAELNRTHKELIATSRLAGMAEVATGVLHNVGNVLNSVNVSATCLTEQVRKAPVDDLTRLVALLREQGDHLGAFFTTDPRGPKAVQFLAQVADRFSRQRDTQLKELASLAKNVEHIKDIVAMQQSYAKVSGVTETLKVTDLVEDTLRMNAGAFQRHEVDVVREVAPDLPPITTDKHKVLQILVNLVRNAKYACDDSGRKDKRITVRVRRGEGRVRIEVADNGVGIPPENLTRIFNHGFTTKKDGHGFGLHSGANAARELGGTLTVHSDGPGQGATFTLELPLTPGRRQDDEQAVAPPGPAPALNRDAA